MEASSTSATSNKRRRIILSYVSPPRPDDLPAIFESLNDDTLTTILEFVGNRSYVTYAGINKRCKEVYLTTKGMTKETFLYGYAPLAAIMDRFDINSNIDRISLSIGVVCYNRRDVMEWALEQNDALLREICNVAAREERFDILEEVCNNFEDVRRFVYLGVDCSAGRHGKLNVLKWLETKGLSFHKNGCATEAAKGGQLHILQWLREEKGLELNRDLYLWAICGGQLHVMKWLREKEVPWYKWTFEIACTAEEGNLEILQWLHNEGCPWHQWGGVVEGELKSEVIEWLLANGYRDRIRS